VGEVLIDCDIHVGYETVLDLAPYLDPATRELVVNCGTNGLGMPTYPWYHPTGWLRNDAFDRASTAVGAQLVGQTLDRVRANVLEQLALDHGVLTPDEAAAFSILPNGMLAAQLSRAYNDWLLEHWLEPEPRLRGLVVVAAQHPEAAAAEIRRVGERDEFVGVFLPGGARIPYGNPVYEPLWRACDDLGLPVVVHTHFEGVGIAGPVTAAGYPDHYGEYHALCGSGMLGHFASILCHGILERFPRTGVMMMEGGLVGFVGLLWRLDTVWRACRSEMPWCVRPPSEYVFERVRFTTQPLEEPPDDALLAPALEGLRPWDTLCFASDYPHWDYDEPRQTLNRLPADWRDGVAHRNAARFFGLPAPVAA
jgi:predicted TIM-barrel fold metal-dependent hydrolase